MKRLTKYAIAVFTVVLILFGQLVCSERAYALQTAQKTDENIIKAYTGGSISVSADVYISKEMQELLNDYFTFRYLNIYRDIYHERLLDSEKYLIHYSYSDFLINELSERRKALQLMSERIGVGFIDIRTKSVVNGISEIDNLCHISYNETVFIDYSYDGSDTTDTMSFGCTHQLYIESNIPSGAKYNIVSDLYDESTSTGLVVSEGNIMNVFIPERNVSDQDINEPKNECLEKEEPNPLRTWGNFNSTAAVTYANTWANSHNPAFSDFDNDGYSSTSDCCNFVSQCLYAGGISPTGAYPNYSTQWYIDSYIWVNVGAFVSFWTPKVGSVQVSGSTANMNNCIPGNPIYYLNSGSGFSGHIVLCTGYTSSGVPFYNGHSNAAYHVPITNITNTLYTLKFRTCPHNSNYTYISLAGGNMALYCLDCGAVIR